MKKLITMFLIFALTLFVVKGVSAGNVKGETEDPYYKQQLGLIKYLGTPSGYHFWFTLTASIPYNSNYDVGHTYHNIYKFNVKDTSYWCPRQTTVPDRKPYNIVAEPGTKAWYKIYDLTTGTYVCGG